MANSFNSNNGVSKIVAILVVLIATVVLISPVVKDMESRQEGSWTETVYNAGVPFVRADADEDIHTLGMALNNRSLQVTVDGQQIPAGMDSIRMPTTGSVKVGPFNTYYVAVNLASGDNPDDAFESRLSKAKGEIAYYLDADNLHKTVSGYPFTASLYNVMVVIPPVYWYSDTVTSKLYISNNPDAFVNRGISADMMKDYAHAYTDSSDSENVVAGHSPAIMLGVYEGYVDNGVLTSQSGVQPTGSLSVKDFVNVSVAGNTDVSYGTYEMWNYYMWTMYKIMCWTVMGNMDSQYMMGAGYVASTLREPAVTGLTSGAIEKASTNTSSVSLFVENSWGSINEWLGDVGVVNGILKAGNSLGGVSDITEINNTLAEDVSLPIVTNVYYATINPISDAFGMATSTTASLGTPGEAINDRYYTTSASERALVTGGRWTQTNNAGLSSLYSSNTWSESSANNGTRLAYVVTDPSFRLPIGAELPYAYIMDYNVNGTVQDVTSIDDDVSASRMPSDTVLNPYWSYYLHTEYPRISDSTESVTLAYGQNALLQVYDSGDVVIQTPAETVNLGRINNLTPTALAVSIQNGVLTYPGGSVSIYAYISSEGDLVKSVNPIVAYDTKIGYGGYFYNQNTVSGLTDIGFSGYTSVSDVSESAVVLAPTKPITSVSVTTHEADSTYVTVLESLNIRTTYEDTDTSDTVISEFIVPTAVSYEVVSTTEDKVLYEIFKYLPIIGIVCLFASFIVPIARNRS